MNEQEKMIAGKLYDPSFPLLAEEREKAHRLSKMYNDTFEDEEKKRGDILDELFPERTKEMYIQGPIFFDYGCYTSFGKNFYANFNFTVLDCCPVTIGNDVMIGPNVSILTPMHPLKYQERNIRKRADGSVYDLEYAKPITIGDNCWIAGNVTILGGVHIGNGSVIGAGSVVTKDIPDNSLAVGNPCRILREITEKDAIELKKELF